ncbi:malonyl CoA:anthocyanin5-O-glucoside-6'''-O-malonyltransferase [Striga asiatica]|uniref:Malonyl CoA:anthocyanin5-O-glucoside-6'''-O-malonyltransferase n=1 Tax=Striga asiatica TaxID=4170 RepID=A0A5A7PFS7_STRAF|nr:malonyl CoA:anthocyanin5-O-glucoside-6'''-O-malonyltransferase [Striga asiatica]
MTTEGSQHFLRLRPSAPADRHIARRHPSPLFPGRANHHTIGDATSIVGFIRDWAKLGVVPNSRPVFERDLIKVPQGLDSIYWNNMKCVPFGSSSTFPLPTNRVRATFVLDRARFKKLKDLVVAEFSELFPPIVFCRDFGLRLDVRYSGPSQPAIARELLRQLLIGRASEIRHHELIGPDGFFLAARAIADEIKYKLNGMDKITEWFENAPKIIRSVLGKCLFSVSGSVRVDLYGADFGLGRARKMEILSIDGEKYTMSLCKPRDCEGGLEVGMSLTKEVRDVFVGLFNDGLNT